MYFADNPNLTDLIILSPQWLANRMSDIISFKNNFYHATAPIEVIEKIWEKYDPKMREFLISLLEKFEVIYRTSLENFKKVIVIPSLLPETPDYDPIVTSTNFEEKRNSGVFIFKRIFNFKFLPQGFFSRIIVRVINTINAIVTNVWRNGIEIKNDEHRTSGIIRFLQEEIKAQKGILFALEILTIEDRDTQ